MNWRPASKRPRNEQRVVVCFNLRGNPKFAIGAFRKTLKTVFVSNGWTYPWTSVASWIPERELERAARAAAKGDVN